MKVFYNDKNLADLLTTSPLNGAKGCKQVEFRGSQMESTEHELKKQSYPGFGSWSQCVDCGCTFHSKHWWLAGYKNKEEPPCDLNNLDSWKESAIKIDMNEL